MHPEFVTAVMPIGGVDRDRRYCADRGLDLPERQGRARVRPDLDRDEAATTTTCRRRSIRGRGPAFHWSVLTLTGYDLGYRQSQGWDAVKPNIFAWDPPEEGFGADRGRRSATMFDAVDLKYRVEVGETHNINALLPDYEPRALVIHIENDLWLTIDKARESVALIPGAQIATETEPDRPLRHLQLAQPAGRRSDGAELPARHRHPADRGKGLRRAELHLAAGQHEPRSGDVVLARQHDPSLPAEVRQGDRRARRRMGDRLPRRGLRGHREPGDPGDRARQGRLRLALRLPDEVRRGAGLPGHRPRHAPLRAVGAWQPRQEPGAHLRGHALGLPRRGRRPARHRARPGTTAIRSAASSCSATRSSIPTRSRA